MSRRAVLICPGRGTYNAPELGYLARHHADHAQQIAQFDARRTAAGLATLSALDGAATFDADLYSQGNNASGLIYACGYLDAQNLASDIEVVAVTGNSMGWYTALAAAGAVTPNAGFEIADKMGQLMHKHLIGGQLVYPFVGDNWEMDTKAKAALLALVDQINAQGDHVLSVSIHLGGMLVLAGNEAGLAAFEAKVPKRGVFPLRLQNHAAFHSHLQTPVAAEGAQALAHLEWGAPKVPMIDGMGKIWWPQGCDLPALARYTLGAQVTQTYDFTQAMRVAAQEFAPDIYIVVGPGTTLGGAVAQSLVGAGWQGMRDREGFERAQKDKQILVAMGRAEQRKQATETQP